jgi:katanin p80 WD40 repeat-containing subunit B1
VVDRLGFRFYLQRQSSCKDVPESAPKNNSIIKHSVSEANISKTSMSSRSSSRKNSFSRSSRNSSVPNVSKIPMNSARTEKNGPVKAPPSYITSTPVDIYVNSKISPDSSPSEEVEFVPVSIDRPVGLDLDDFLPVSGAPSMCVLYYYIYQRELDWICFIDRRFQKHHRSLGFQQQLPDMSEAEVLGALMRGHEPMMAMLVTRQRSLKLVLAQFRSKDIKAATETAMSMGDLAVLVDLLSVFNSK